MIRLTKNNAIHITDHLGLKHEDYKVEVVKKLSSYLNERVELCDGFTLADLFDYIEKEKVEFDVIFNSQLGPFSLQLYIDEIKKPGPVKDDEIDYLEIGRYSEYFEGDIELYLDFGGVNEKTDIGYAIEFTPLNEIKHLPLRLNHNFSISEVKIVSKFKRCFVKLLGRIGIPLKRWRTIFDYVYVQGQTTFTLYELISAVLYEISFAENPEMRMEDTEDEKSN